MDLSFNALGSHPKRAIESLQTLKKKENTDQVKEHRDRLKKQREEEWWWRIEEGKEADEKVEPKKKAKKQVKKKRLIGGDFDDIESLIQILEPPIQHDVAATFAEMFKTNRSLIHVDLSYNSLKTRDC